MAWHIAALGRVKRLPQFLKFLGQKAARLKPQTAAQMESIARMWASATKKPELPLAGAASRRVRKRLAQQSAPKA